MTGLAGLFMWTMMHYAWVVMHTLLIKRVFMHTMLLDGALDVNSKCVMPY